MWKPISTAPWGMLVMTKIDDARGIRNVQPMSTDGSLWFAGDMYVYYSPTHWRPLTEIERLKIKNEAERKAIAAMEQTERLLGY